MRKDSLKILVTGADGFIGSNLTHNLSVFRRYEVFKYTRMDTREMLASQLEVVDIVVHLAGENRPDNEELFSQTNFELTKFICDSLKSKGRRIPLILASSTQAAQDSNYGKSKLAAEVEIQQLGIDNGNDIYIYRLPGVFGKWSRPNYNSVVATFCHNIANGLPVSVNNPTKLISLVYIDDVIDSFLSIINNDMSKKHINVEIEPIYEITLSALAAQIEAFNNCRDNLISERVGEGIGRALYATYISFLPKPKFSYDIPLYGDERGIFVEMLKTPDSGQFSYFTAHPGVTRGGHYHHTKSEKFLVVKGYASFGFRNIVTQETLKIETSGDDPTIVETIPGWAHDITNIGEEDMIVMLWANEIFDREKPDTYTAEV